MNKTAAILLLCFVSALTDFAALAVDIPTVLQGKSGKDLAVAIRNYCAPTSYLGSEYGESGIWCAFRTTDINSDGTIIDRYSTARPVFPPDNCSPVPSMVIDRIVATSWYSLFSDLAKLVEFDLYNVIPADAAVATHKKNYPPGIVEIADYDNGTWKAGKGFIFGIEANMYEPADEYKGDFARAILYVTAVYPCKLWDNLGTNFFDDNDFPTLNDYSRQLLLKWHSDDPVSDIERRRNDAVETIQGNRNPFVDYPHLTDHIWGDKADEEFIIDNEPHPLKPSYRLHDDAIDLVSPHIPADAIWSIDGIPATKKSYKPTELGPGSHELRFNSSNFSGKIIIVITQ